MNVSLVFLFGMKGAQREDEGEDDEDELLNNL
jgi:hypothetical protein